MAVAKTQRARTKAEINLPDDGVIASVTEIERNPDTNTVRTVKYEAPVNLADTDTPESGIDSEISDDQSEDHYYEPEPEPLPEVPKSKIEKMFDRIRYAVETNQCEDYFYANVSRLPDPINSRYFFPCNMLTDLGTFQFNSQSMFQFPAELQRINNHSGGMFNVNVYTIDGKPLEVEYSSTGYRHHTIKQPVGMVNYTVNNPPPTVDGKTGQPQGIEQTLMKFMDDANKRFEMILQQMNRPQEKSTIEKALEQKLVNDLLNPQANNPTSGVEQMFANMLTLPLFMEKFTERVFPEKAAPAEPSMIDHVEKVLQIPAVQQLATGLVNVSEQFAISKMAQMNPQPQPQQEMYEDENGMQELITELITELESDRPLDANNQVIANLIADYPDQAKMIITTCKSMPFEPTLGLLVNLTADIQPFPFAEFIDLETTQATKQMVWNERGERLKVRLEQFYNFARTA